jgi:hypothetical protein
MEKNVGLFFSCFLHRWVSFAFFVFLILLELTLCFDERKKGGLHLSSSNSWKKLGYQIFIYLFIFACMLFFSPSTATHSEDIYILRG